MTDDWNKFDWSEAEAEAFGRAIAAKLREPRVPDPDIGMDWDLEEDLEEDLEPAPDFADRVMARVAKYGPYIPYPTPHLRGYPPVQIHLHDVPPDGHDAGRRAGRVRPRWDWISRRAVVIGSLLLAASVTIIIMEKVEGPSGRTHESPPARQQAAQRYATQQHPAPHVAVAQPSRQFPVTSTPALVAPRHGAVPGATHEVPTTHSVVTPPVQHDPLWGEVEATPAPPPEPTTTSQGEQITALLEGRVSPAVRGVIKQIADSLQAAGIPDVLVIDKALEEAAKGADDARILAVVRQVAHELLTVRRAWPVLPQHTAPRAASTIGISTPHAPNDGHVNRP